MHYTVAIASEFPIFAGLVRGSRQSNTCETNTFYFLRSSSNEPIGNAWSPHRIAVQSYYCYDPMIIYACQRNNLLLNAVRGYWRHLVFVLIRQDTNFLLIWCTRRVKKHQSGPLISVRLFWYTCLGLNKDVHLYIKAYTSILIYMSTPKYRCPPAI